MKIRRFVFLLFLGIFIAASIPITSPRAAYAQGCGVGIAPVPCPPEPKRKKPKPTPAATRTPTWTATPNQNYAFAGLPKPTPTQVPPNMNYSPLNNMPAEPLGIAFIALLIGLLFVGGLFLVRSRFVSPGPPDVSTNPGPPDVAGNPGPPDISH